MLVVPIVEDVLDEIGVGAGRHALEEISCDSLDVSGMPTSLQHVSGALDDFWPIEQDPLEVWKVVQDEREQRTVPPAHIDELAERRKVIRRGHGIAAGHAQLGHGLLEDRETRRVLAEPREAILAEYFVEGRLARAHAVIEAAPRRPA